MDELEVLSNTEHPPAPHNTNSCRHTSNTRATGRLYSPRTLLCSSTEEPGSSCVLSTNDMMLT